MNWLISYAYRRPRTSEWDFGNDAYRGALSAWFEEMSGMDEIAEFALLSATPLSQSEFTRIKDYV